MPVTTTWARNASLNSLTRMQKSMESTSPFLSTKQVSSSTNLTVDLRTFVEYFTKRSKQPFKVMVESSSIPLDATASFSTGGEGSSGRRLTLRFPSQLCQIILEEPASAPRRDLVQRALMLVLLLKPMMLLSLSSKKKMQKATRVSLRKKSQAS